MISHQFHPSSWKFHHMLSLKFAQLFLWVWQLHCTWYNMEDNHCWRHGVMIWTGANYVGCFGNETLPHVFINAAFLILSHHNAIFLIDTFRIWMHITSCVNVYAFLSMYTMEPPPACWCFIVCSMVKVIASITRFIRWHSWIHGFITVIITSRITIIIIFRIAPAICEKLQCEIH